ncbi:Hypothetical protein RG1141_CH42110 [Neorhizobium galegae bv. officinalis bv. officinalis str. HAMBI 1141]|uniref:Uncharacterized protein n=1 Tax=Neorhizobium galegae bv. officinalis bv. officinalis str. HAMBI 1141 TaxID=1028801 RepID=A0A068TGF6_NEOGA|nr:hypothetical protein [Neorhizobium galegae]CDN56525.1 Hypothetical protein RG1141_CH42110 [Neorhizobium galegae bv. officinalis bv. officinalis str. HAMBI 1141]
MRNILTGMTETAHHLALALRDALSRHFSLSIGGDMPGLFVKVPFTSFSAWAEWGAPHAGYGTERASATDIEFFLGTVRGVLSVEKTVEQHGA